MTCILSIRTNRKDTDRNNIDYVEILTARDEIMADFAGISGRLLDSVVSTAVIDGHPCGSGLLR